MNTAATYPASCIKQTRREHFQSLVMRVLLESNGLWRTSPRVKSSKVGGAWCLTFKRFRYKPFSASPPSLFRRFVCNVKVMAMARLRDKANGYDRLAGLSARERKVLELIGDGLSNRQIGERLSVSEKTVKNHVSVLFVKLGMEQRTQAAAYAARIFHGRTSGLSQDMRIINWKSREG